MEFEIGQDMGSFRQTVWKGLTIKEIVAMGSLVIVVGGGVIFLKDMIDTQMIGYMGALIVAPIMASTFFHKQDMLVWEYLGKMALPKKQILTYISTEDAELTEKFWAEQEILTKKSEKKEKKLNRFKRGVKINEQNAKTKKGR